MTPCASVCQCRVPWQFMLALLAALYASFGVSLGTARAATPGWPELTIEQQRAIVDATYDSVGITPVPYADQAATGTRLSHDMDDASGRTGSNSGSDESSLLQAAGLLPATGVLAPELVIGAAGVLTAVVIIRHLNGGTDRTGIITTANASGDFTYDGLWWHQAGTAIYGGVTVPAPGAYLFSGSKGGDYYPIVRWFEKPCPFDGQTPTNARMSVGNATSSGYTCLYNSSTDPNVWAPAYAPIVVDYPYKTPEDLSWLFRDASADDYSSRARLRDYYPTDPGGNVVLDKVGDWWNNTDTNDAKNVITHGVGIFGACDGGDCNTANNLGLGDEVNEVKGALTINNPNSSLSADEVATVADACVYQAAKANLDYRDCESLPIFWTGSDLPKMAAADASSLASYWPWTRLSRATGKRSGWYSSYCSAPDGMACHEFPFLATDQGGPDDQRQSGSPFPSLKPLDSTQNSLQGSFLGGFYSSCGLAASTDPWAEPGSPFLYLALPVSGAPPTGKLCNNGT